ncbi:AlpA family transcriptional regulator [Rhodoferax sp. PAMC 29310]|uniref:helix-turn-helix transcriptional regulator n=1 Tax=Rhodoferax sp. PAMC 29310 TaxID=2822760 RepID=UPI001B343EFE|nr:AlpA family phage regulatory protein [Rhodoferax sp. PAMC 29310]
MNIQTNPTASNPERLLRLPEVESRVGLRKSSIYEMLGRNPPAFPRPLKLSRRAVCWPASEIDAWIQVRIKAGAQK